MLAWIAVVLGVIAVALAGLSLYLAIIVHRVTAPVRVRLPRGHDPDLPNHYMADSLGDPRVCTGEHNHPARGPWRGIRHG